MDCSIERLCRQRLGFPIAANGGSQRAFYGKIQQISVFEDELIVEIYAFKRYLYLKAQGKCAQICKAFMGLGKRYTFSGWEGSVGYVINIGIGCEISRPKPPFTEFDVLYEKLVDVNFLHLMATSREFPTEEDELDLQEERYYVLAYVLGYDSWPATYQGCNNPYCYGARVYPTEDFTYRCQKCENESETYESILMAKLVLLDPEVSILPVQGRLCRRGRPVRPPFITVSIFKDSIEAFIGKTTAELVDLQRDNEGKFREVCGGAISRKLVFRLRANVFRGAIGFNVDRIFL